MKRALEDYTVEIDRLSELLEKLPPDAIMTVLANLRPDELHALSKLPGLGIVRSILNDTHTFKDLYDMRKAETVRSKLSYAEEDLVNFLGDVKIDYWHVFLCAYNSTMGTHFPTLVNKSGTVKILLAGEALDFEYAYEIDASMLSDTKLQPMISSSGNAYRLILWRVLHSIVDSLIAPQPLPERIDHNMHRIFGIRLGNLDVESFADALTLHNPKFMPKQMLEYELLYDTYTVLASRQNVMNNVAQGTAGIQRAKNIVQIFRRFFSAVYSYLLLSADPNLFLETTNLILMRPKVTGIRQQCWSCENSAVYKDMEARYFCSQQCQKLFY